MATSEDEQFGFPTMYKLQDEVVTAIIKKHPAKEDGGESRRMGRKNRVDVKSGW